MPVNVMRAVVFELRTPLASWAEGGAALRPTDFVPSWSAMVGMVGAALGWPRGDERLVRFANDYALAVSVHSPGTRIEDFHTIQSPTARQATALRARNRADEMSVDDIHTSITRREYVSDARYTIAMFELSVMPVVAIDLVATALGDPVFPLYAGRRGCALGRVAASVVEGPLDVVLPKVTHWDWRIDAPFPPAVVRERRDMLVGDHKFTVRHEATR